MDQLVEALVPGMPRTARAAVTAQAQGVPLFAVETVRALIDRDIVEPIEGLYRLTGEVGELAVPDSLHALLVPAWTLWTRVRGGWWPTRRYWAPHSPPRRWPRSAGRTKPRCGPRWMSWFAARCSPCRPTRCPRRRAVTGSPRTCSAKSLTELSRRDRKARHLKVAAHLRAAFAADGEEVANVIARHYLDALAAVPDAPDALQIRGQAIAALIRAGERAQRTGAPAVAVTATPRPPNLVGKEPGQSSRAGRLWEHAAQAAIANRDSRRRSGTRTALGNITWHKAIRGPPPVPRPPPGRPCALGPPRRGARAAGSRPRGAAHDPDADTVRALDELAMVEVFAGSPDGIGCPAKHSCWDRPSASGSASSPRCSRVEGSTMRTLEGARKQWPISPKPPG